MYRLGGEESWEGVEDEEEEEEGRKGENATACSTCVEGREERKGPLRVAGKCPAEDGVPDEEVRK